MAITTTILIIVGIVIILIVGIYNKFIRLTNAVKKSWAGIDVQLKRRADLIPNLVGAVKGYAKHEKTLLTNITKMRTQVMTGLKDNDLVKTGKADAKLSGLLKNLFMVSENYPDLKANKNFLDLQNQLGDTEDQIAASRRIYNENVTYYTVALQVFPNNLFAKIFGFKSKQLFEANESERKNVKVEL
jgi:LemA protein